MDALKESIGALNTSVAPRWDLADLFRGPDDPELDVVLHGVEAAARDLELTSKGKIASGSVDGPGLAAILWEYESICRRRAHALAFAGLRFAADTTDPERGALSQRVQLLSSNVANHLLFVDLELGLASDAVCQAWLDAESVQPFRHHIERVRRYAMYFLSESEERVLETMSNSGARAWTRLYYEVMGRARYQVDTGDGRDSLTQPEMMAMLYDSDRERRQAAAAANAATLALHSHVCTYILNTLIQEKAGVDRLRGYACPEDSMHEQNELPGEIAELVVDVCRSAYPLVHRYYRLKRGMLGLPSLTHVDRYAPIGSGVPSIPYASARTAILSAFGRLGPEARGPVEQFFDRNWIDAEPRPGKRSGAFCSSVAPDRHPYVFMSYNDRPRDAMVLAHELGHGLHGMLSRGQHILDFYPSLPMAETASVFAEMLLFDQLQSELDEPGALLSLCCGRLEDSISTVFRQTALYEFEQRVHRAGRLEGELTTGRISSIWQEALQPMFGDALSLEEEHAGWWMAVPHFFSTPFYVYAYSFGELMVLSLYQRFREEGSAFVSKFLALLSQGSSQPPVELLAGLGIDISQRSFWEGGIQVISGLVDRVEGLASASEARAFDR